jgi:hypothetical protein
LQTDCKPTGIAPSSRWPGDVRRRLLRTWTQDRGRGPDRRAS